MTWHDGAPLTAEDFAFAWRVYRDPDFGYADSAPLAQIEEVRDDTLVLDAEAQDEDATVPYWVVSTRHPDRLIAALTTPAD